MLRKRTHNAGAPGGEVEGTRVEVVPLEAAEAAARAQGHRRRLALAVIVPTILVGLVVVAAQVKVGGGGPGAETPAASGWESGMQLIESGQTAKGTAVLEAAVDRLPQGPERTRAHLRLAEVYRELRDKDGRHLNSAVRHYTAVLDSADGAAPVEKVLYEAGLCFARVGSYESALECFERLEAEFPASLFRPEAQFEVGECLLAIGRYQSAREVLAEVAETYRDDPLGEKAFFRFADSFSEQAQSLKRE